MQFPDDIAAELTRRGFTNLSSYPHAVWAASVHGVTLYAHYGEDLSVMVEVSPPCGHRAPDVPRAIAAPEPTWEGLRAALLEALDQVLVLTRDHRDRRR